MAYYAYQKLGSYCKRQIIPYRNSHDQAIAIAISISISISISNAIALALVIVIAIAIAIVAAAVTIALLGNYPYLNFRVPALGLIVAV